MLCKSAAAVARNSNVNPTDPLQSFMLAVSALFSIVNPIGAALIFSQVTADRTHEQRVALARLIGFYSALIMLGALWAGAYILGFFGVSLAALRIAGGLFVATRAWNLLSEPERIEAMKQRQAEGAEGASAVAFFPLTMPFTTGPAPSRLPLLSGPTVRCHPSLMRRLLLGRLACGLGRRSDCGCGLQLRGPGDLAAR
jgi:multiple antibiotic resistance protein